MTDQQIQTRKTKELIKTIMKKKGYKYEDLAKALKVSVPTIKRILNKEELSMERFFAILAWLGLNHAQFAKLAEEYRKEEFAGYSEEQERFLLEHPDHHYFLAELMDGYSPQQLAKRFNLNPYSLQKYLFDLDRLNFIELQAEGKVRLLNKGQVRTKEGGTLDRQYAEKWCHLTKTIFHEAIMAGDTSPRLFSRSGLNLLLRRESFEQLRSDIIKLKEKYASISSMEKVLEPHENLLRTYFTFLIADTNARERIFAIPRNFEEPVEPPVETTT